MFTQLGCLGCFQKFNEMFDKQLKKDMKPIITTVFLPMDGSYLSKSLLKNTDCLYDKEAELSNYNLGIYNFAVIETANSKITGITSFNSSDSNKVDELIKKL